MSTTGASAASSGGVTGYLPGIMETMSLLLQRILKKHLSLQEKKAGTSHLKESDLRQDEDVLDTWFSSWLWPITSFDGINNPDNPDLKYYYPTNDLITAPEILFFWVARMIIAGY